MAEAVLDIKQWGNSLGVRTSVKGDQLIITPLKDAQPTLEQRLAVYNPKRHGGEQMTTTDALGAEHW